jgi:hypothetical protein
VETFYPEEKKEKRNKKGKSGCEARDETRRQYIGNVTPETRRRYIGNAIPETQRWIRDAKDNVEMIRDGG